MVKAEAKKKTFKKTTTAKEDPLVIKVIGISMLVMIAGTVIIYGGEYIGIYSSEFSAGAFITLIISVTIMSILFYVETVRHLNIIDPSRFKKLATPLKLKLFILAIMFFIVPGIIASFIGHFNPVQNELLRGALDIALFWLPFITGYVGIIAIFLAYGVFKKHQKIHNP